VSYLYAFLGFAALIVLHEAGHFAAAKAVGMRVERFSLFFGPMWAKKTIGETQYGIGIIPLGGFVKITGMSSAETFDTPEIEARAYMNQPVWKRIVVIAAGPAVNLVLAFILAWVFFMGQSQAVTTSSGQPVVAATVVGSVLSHTPAAAVLKSQDKIISVDGVRISNATVLHNQIVKDKCSGGATTNGCPGAKPLTIVVKRDGVLHTFKIRPRYNAKDKEQLIGIEPVELAKLIPNTAGSAVGQSITGLWRVTKQTVSDLAQLFKSKDRKQLSGVVGAYRATAASIRSGGDQTIQIMALISLSLGVINLFPFLPLDGGHIFWAIAEKVRGRRISLVLIERSSLIGVALILLLFVIGLSNDLSSHAKTLSGH
jgi:regulator of sigma E protease